MFKTRTFLALVLLPLLIFLVACGGDDDDDDSDSNGSDQPAATESSGGQTDDDSDDDADDAEDDDNDSSSGGSGDLAPECVEFAEVGASIAATFSGAATGTAENFEETAQFYQELADAAPDEIKADMQILADALTGFFSILDEHDIDLSNPASFATLDPSVQAELQAELEAFSVPEITQAAENVGNWFESNCQ